MQGSKVSTHFAKGHVSFNYITTEVFLIYASPTTLIYGKKECWRNVHFWQFGKMSTGEMSICIPDVQGLIRQQSQAKLRLETISANKSLAN